MAIETYVPSAYLVPGHFLFAEYGGSFGPSGDQRHVLVVGPMSDLGTGTVNTLYDVQDDTHSDLLCGKGSFTAALCRAARVQYSAIPIKLVITEDNGAGAAATGDLVPAGPATSDGTLTVDIAGREYTGSITTGDTAEEICETLNLLINPTKLEMACRLANEIKLDFNAHIASVVFHTAADGVNAMVAAAATNLATLLTLINEARTNYEAHRILVGGGPVHGQADTINALSAAVATDLDSAVVLAKDIKAKFTSHQAYITGLPVVHLAADTVNVLVGADPVDETHPHLPVTSWVDIAGPHVTVDAKCLGTMGNQIRVRVSTDAGGVTFTEPADNRLAAGANEPDYDSAFAVGLADEHHHVAPVTNDQTVLTAATVGLKDRLIAAEAALVQHRMIATIGHNGTPPQAETLADGFDYYRMQIGSIESDTPPWEIAGSLVGLECYRFGNRLSANLAGSLLMGVVAPNDNGDYPTEVEIDNAMHQGVTLMRINSSGQVLVTYPITSQHTDGLGAEDLSVWGVHKVVVGDALAKKIVTAAALTYSGFMLQDDPADPNEVIPRATVTPARFETFLYEEVVEYEGEGHLKAGSVSDHESSIHAEINGANPNRLDYEYPFDVIDHFLTSSGVGKQVG